APPASAPAGPDPEIIERLAALEAELAAVSDSHARLEGELQASRDQADSLRGRLEAVARTPAAGADLESVLADLDAVSRERNDLAAQLAALRSAAPAAPARRSRARPKPAELPGLLEDPPASVAPDPGPPAVPDPPALPTPAPEPAPAPVAEFLAPCPQRLHEVAGIGPAAESRLYAAGIGSYWQLSRMSDAALADALEVEGGPPEPFDFAAVRAEALQLARETCSEGRCWNQEPPDDLAKIEGLGPAGERRLHEAGLCTYEALARMTPAGLAGICPGPGLEEADYARWIGQAARLAAAREF
ncbi:MAG: helix-hairpin-helix domain-containing protein, partial [Verrucomicrobiota bacterium]